MELQTKELRELPSSKAEQIKNTFEPMTVMLSEFEDEYNVVLKDAEDGITKELEEKAKKLRLSISKVRIETEKERKKQKAEYVLAGKAIDGVANILKWAVSEKENSLKEIEEYAKKQEQERLDSVQKERQEALAPFVEDAHERDLSSMDADVWEAYFTTKKQAHADKLEAERKAEEQRIKAEQEKKAEAERIRKENAALKAERDKRAKLEAERKAKAETERKAMQAKLDAEQKAKEEAERKARAEAEAATKAHEAALKAERDKQAKLEAEIEAQKRAKLEAERKAKAETEAQKEAELKKGDADKVNDLLRDLSELKTKYVFTSNKYKRVYSGVCSLINKVITYINQ